MLTNRILHESSNSKRIGRKSQRHCLTPRNDEKDVAVRMEGVQAELEAVLITLEDVKAERDQLVTEHADQIETMVEARLSELQGDDNQLQEQNAALLDEMEKLKPARGSPSDNSQRWDPPARRRVGNGGHLRVSSGERGFWNNAGGAGAHADGTTYHDRQSIRSFDLVGFPAVSSRPQMQILQRSGQGALDILNRIEAQRNVS